MWNMEHKECMLDVLRKVRVFVRVYRHVAIEVHYRKPRHGVIILNSVAQRTRAGRAI